MSLKVVYVVKNVRKLFSERSVSKIVISAGWSAVQIGNFVCLVL